MLTVLHGGHAHRGVPLPRRGGVDQIHVLLLAQPDEVPVAALSEGLGFWRARGHDPLLGLLDLLRPDVAQGRNPAALDLEQVIDVTLALVADAHKPHPDEVLGFAGPTRGGRRSVQGIRTPGQGQAAHARAQGPLLLSASESPCDSVCRP